MKCRDCKWLTADKRSSIGHECLQPEKKSAWDEKESKIGKKVVARYKQPSMKSCKMYEPKEDLDREIAERLRRARAQGMSELIRREDALKAVRGYFKGQIEKTPTGTMDGEEVYTDMDAVDRILEQNKAICKAIEGIPEVKV